MNNISSFKRYIKNTVKHELAECFSRNRIMIKEGKDYVKLQQVIWCDSDRCANDEGMMDELNQMYEDRDYQGMINYLSQWDYGYENGGEYYDDVEQYDDILAETNHYILVTVDPRHYWGDRPFGLYVKLTQKDCENLEL